MDAPSLTPERFRELADLRRRAYGPDADIQRDPTAVRRLHELEDLVRDPAEREPSPRVPDAQTAAAQPPARPPAPAAVSEHRPRATRRIPLWAVALAAVVAGVMIGASALWLVQRSASVEAAPDVTLHRTSSAPARGPGFTQGLDFWGVERGSLAAYDSFSSIGVWTARSTDGSRCILLSSAGQIFTANCAAKDLDPVFDLTINANLQVDFNGMLPEGSVIRFVARAGAVDVWVRPAPAGPTSPTS
jgi:hypothetical protein